MIISNNSIKSQIQSQVPWFYNQEYPLFVKFLEYYYEWTEIFSEETPFGYQAILDNLTNFQDIDDTLDDIIPFFKDLYFRLIPEETFVPTRLFAKRIIDLYKSKGTLKSIELLIYIILGKPVDLFLPKTLLARSSETLFGTKFFIICYPEDNLNISLFYLEKKFITIDGIDFFVNNIIRYYNFFIISLDLEIISNFVSNEIYFNNNLVAKCLPVLSSIKVLESSFGFKKGDQIFVSNISNNFKPAILLVSEISKGQVDTYSIINGGSGYKKGDQFYNNDINFLAEVFKVDELGSVLEIVFTLNSNFIEVIPEIFISSKTGKNLDIVWKCSELGKIQEIDILFSGVNLDKNNLLYSKTGIKFKPEISYIVKDSKQLSGLNNLGNFNILPDNFYYQKFSYEIEIELSETFNSKSIVRELLHPAGFLDFYKNTFFSNSSINNITNFISLSSEIYYLQILLELLVLETGNFYELLKYSNADVFLNFSDFNTTRFNELYYLSSDVNISLENISSLDTFENIDNQNIKLNLILNLLTSN